MKIQNMTTALKKRLRRLFFLLGISVLGLSSVTGFSQSKPQAGPLALINGTLIDGTGAAPILHAALVIENGKVLAAGKMEQITIPKDAKVINVKNNTIMPGFFNAHVHGAFNAERLKEWAQAGVTSVRDMSANIGSVNEIKNLRKNLDRPDCARLYTTGPIITTVGGYGGLPVASPEDGRKKTLMLINAGVDAIKISLEDGYAGASGLPKLSQDELRAIISTAHKLGKRVTVHITQARYLKQAVAAGVDEIAHIAYDPVPDEVLQTMARKNIYLIPTFTIFRHYNAPIENCIANLQKFIKAGGRVALGNDTGGFEGYEPGMPMYEIECMQKAGMTPMEIIVAATRNGAYVCNQADTLGTLKAGMTADLWVAQGNPLEDLNVFSKALLVIKGGKIVINKLR
ncbi:MAG: amidohydrolase family protein [Firmicutes bacterium]|nr:amidohydrolase family protein [Bacillota bacterium]